MNLQPVAIEIVPIGKPLPWQLYDRDGYTLFSRGEVIASRSQLEVLAADGLLRDVDALPQAEETVPWTEFKELPPSDIFPPQGIKPQVGERVQLRLLGRDTQTYYLARLIGYIKDQSILLTTPAAAGQRIMVSDGERLEVRMLTGSNIYVFQSEILRVCISPSYYIHLQYPTLVRMQKVRSAPRTRVNLVASVTVGEGAPEIAEITNLSPDGAQLRIPRDVGRAGSAIRISFQANVDGDKTILILGGVIQHVRRAAPDQGLGTEMLEYAVAFTDVSAENRLWLRCLVYKHIAEGFLA